MRDLAKIVTIKELLPIEGKDRIEVNGKSFKVSRDCFRRVSNDEGLYIKNYHKFSVVDAEQKNGAYFWEYEC